MLRTTCAAAPKTPASTATRTCIRTTQSSRALKEAASDCHDPHPPPGSARRSGAALQWLSYKDAHSDQDFHGAVACTSCHKPHEFALAKTTDRSLCSGCHAAQVSATLKRVGHENCTECHTGLPHHPATQASCATCHAAEVHAALKGHAQCTSCHEPHSGAQAAPCESCHAQVSAQRACRPRTMSEMPSGRTRGRCGSCRVLHVPRQ